MLISDNWRWRYAGARAIRVFLPGRHGGYDIMAFVFTLLSMLMTSARDLFEKKSVESSTDDALKTLVWYGIFNAILFFLVFFLGMDETSRMPHELIFRNPVILLSPALNYICLLFALMAYKYLGVSVRNTFVNTDGLFFVILLVLYHTLTGRAGYATRLFDPLTMTGLVLVIGAGIIYPNLKERGAEKSSEAKPEWTSKVKGMVILGLVVSVISAFFDGAESMVSSVLIGDEIVDSIDFICLLALIQVIISFFVWLYLWIKNKRIYNPFRKSEKYRYIGQGCGLLSDLLYVFALSDDALLGIILWNAFPVIDIVAARIFMKEKLTARQYLTLSIMIIGAVFISLS